MTDDPSLLVALRHQNRITRRRVARSELPWLFWTPGFFQRPGIHGHQDGGLYPQGDGLVAIDADHRWVGVATQGASPTLDQPGKSLLQSLQWAQRAAEAGRRVNLMLDVPSQDREGPSTTVPLALKRYNAEGLWEAMQEGHAQAVSMAAAARAPLEDSRVRLAPAWHVEHFHAYTGQGWQAFGHALIDRGWSITPGDLAKWEAYGSGSAIDGFADAMAGLCARVSEQHLEGALQAASPRSAPPRPRL